MKDLKFLVTLSPSFPHYKEFASDHRLSGIRLNSAMMNIEELDKELEIANSIPDSVPLWYDIKGRQLRVVEAIYKDSHIELIINHPIQVQLPTRVLFKAEMDWSLLTEIGDGGTRLIFGDGDKYGPKWKIKAGESLHIRHKSLVVGGNVFTDLEKQKIDITREAGLTRYFLSYVEKQSDVDEFRELVGDDSDIFLKIESKAGLEYVANEWEERPGVHLMAARGDLYVELDQPHQIMNAMKLIIAKDPYAYVGSRLLLSVVRTEKPECCDFSDMAWLYDIGYRGMMLCDEICLKEDLLKRAMDAMMNFRQVYAKDVRMGLMEI